MTDPQLVHRAEQAYLGRSSRAEAGSALGPPSPARRRCCGGVRNAVSANSSFQAPAALIRIRAVTTSRTPRALSTSRQRRYGARTQRVRVRITAPCSAASTASRTTSVCVVGEAIGKFEGMMEPRLQRHAGLVGHQIELARARQNFAPADPVVDQKSDAQTVAERWAGSIGNTKRTGGSDAVRRAAIFPARAMRRGPDRTAVARDSASRLNEFRRHRRGAEARSLRRSGRREPAAGGVAGDAGAVDTAADDGEIEVGH